MRVLRRIAGFDAKGMASLALWVARRRDGVPPGALAVSYSRAQSATMILLLVMMAVEVVVVEVVLRAFDVLGLDPRADPGRRPVRAARRVRGGGRLRHPAARRHRPRAADQVRRLLRPAHPARARRLGAHGALLQRG
ncbi:hypothetical protein ACFSTC_47585 [Nonomuraea ferruginea]